jgi:hypothetical protein
MSARIRPAAISSWLEHAPTRPLEPAPPHKHASDLQGATAGRFPRAPIASGHRARTTSPPAPRRPSTTHRTSIHCASKTRANEATQKRRDRPRTLSAHPRVTSICAGRLTRSPIEQTAKLHCAASISGAGRMTSRGQPTRPLALRSETAASHQRGPTGLGGARPVECPRPTPMWVAVMRRDIRKGTPKRKSDHMPVRGGPSLPPPPLRAAARKLQTCWRCSWLGWARPPRRRRG